LVLFCDGHVQWYPTADLIIDDVDDRPPGNERDRAIAKMWNADHKP
jgi:hypothetical protein